MNIIKIFNGSIILPNEIIENGCILIKDGKIAEVSDSNINASECLEIDAEGCYISPGFIDIHTHGGGGHDFMDGTVSSFIGSAKLHSKHGTTSLLPTISSSSVKEIKSLLEVYSEAKKSISIHANFLGIHLEGPYFASSQKGAQDSKYLKFPDKKEYMEILSLSDDILRWSAAPELDGALLFGQTLKSRRILPSIGHSDATYDEVIKAYENGFTHITHLYSGTSMVTRKNSYRYAGIVESAYLIDDMSVEIIADGSHLPPSLLKLAYKVKGPEKIALITDSMRAAGMPNGPSILGNKETGQTVIVEDNVAKLLDRSSFAGSVATADNLVRNMLVLAGVPLIDAIKMMSTTPAKIIGISDKKGLIAKNYDADIIIFDKEINIKKTIINGEIFK